MINKWCVHCLAIRSAMNIVRASYIGEDGLQYRVICDNPTDTLWLITWLDSMVGRDKLRFETNQSMDTFIPIATYRGDPVCVVHLWDLTDPMRRMR